MALNRFFMGDARISTAGATASQAAADLAGATLRKLGLDNLTFVACKLDPCAQDDQGKLENLKTNNREVFDLFAKLLATITESDLNARIDKRGGKPPDQFEATGDQNLRNAIDRFNAAAETGEAPAAAAHVINGIQLRGIRQISRISSVFVDFFKGALQSILKATTGEFDASALADRILELAKIAVLFESFFELICEAQKAAEELAKLQKEAESLRKALEKKAEELRAKEEERLKIIELIEKTKSAIETIRELKGKASEAAEAQRR